MNESERAYELKRSRPARTLVSENRARLALLRDPDDVIQADRRRPRVTGILCVVGTLTSWTIWVSNVPKHRRVTES